MNVAAVRKLQTASPRARALAENIAFADRQTCVTRCHFCRWSWEGPVAEGKRRYQAHLRAVKNHAGPEGARTRMARA